MLDIIFKKAIIVNSFNRAAKAQNNMQKELITTRLKRF